MCEYSSARVDSVITSSRRNYVPPVMGDGLMTHSGTGLTDDHMSLAAGSSLHQGLLQNLSVATSDGSMNESVLTKHHVSLSQSSQALLAVEAIDSSLDEMMIAAYGD